MLLLASGLVLLFFSLSAILQISIGQIHLRGVAMPFSGFLGSFFGRMFLKFFNYFEAIHPSDFASHISLPDCTGAIAFNA